MRGGAAAAMGQTPLPAGARTRAQPAARTIHPPTHSAHSVQPIHSPPRPRSYDYGEQYLEVNADHGRLPLRRGVLQEARGGRGGGGGGGGAVTPRAQGQLTSPWL